jgi:hypothetical protein
MKPLAAHVIATNDHEDLELMINTWLRNERPERIRDIQFVANGSEFTYAVLVLYVPSRKKPVTYPLPGDEIK